jgi:hypothetical protein
MNESLVHSKVRQRKVTLGAIIICHLLLNYNFTDICSRCEIPEEPEDEDEALMGPSYKKNFKKQQ